MRLALAGRRWWFSRSSHLPAIRRAIWWKNPVFWIAASRSSSASPRRPPDLDVTTICGYVGRSEAQIGKRALNSAAVLERGKIVFRQHKMLLPTYDVFDEARYFRPAEREELCTLRGRTVALTICEDAWNDKRLLGAAPLPARSRGGTVHGGAPQVLICINASPYHMGKREIRREHLSLRGADATASRWCM